MGMNSPRTRSRAKITRTDTLTVGKPGKDVFFLNAGDLFWTENRLINKRDGLGTVLQIKKNRFSLIQFMNERLQNQPSHF